MSPQAQPYFTIPDLISYCNISPSYHPNGSVIAEQSATWMNAMCPDLSPKEQRALRGLKAGEFAACCCPGTTTERLRIISDFINYLFYLDNTSDKMTAKEASALSDTVMNALWFQTFYQPTKGQPDDEMNAGKVARDFWARFELSAGCGVQARLKDSLGRFFEAINIEAGARTRGEIPDIESYIELRRDTSACKPCCALIEYGLDIDLPSFVVEHPGMEALNQGANDIISWANDLYSYNIEQSRGDAHNMVAIIMQHHGYDVQRAVDYVGGLCTNAIDTFNENRKKLPSWGSEIDDMVERYVQGLLDWVVGSFHWSFLTYRYFGSEGVEIKKRGIITLLPRVLEPPAGSGLSAGCT